MHECVWKIHISREESMCVFREECINQLWKKTGSSGAHACNVRNQQTSNSRTHRNAPLSCLGSASPFKNPNPRPMIYQTLIIKKMSREGHLAPHWRRTPVFPPPSSRNALHSLLCAAINQLASSPPLLFPAVSITSNRLLREHGKCTETTHFMFFPLRFNPECFWCHLYVKEAPYFPESSLGRGKELRCPWCWNAKNFFSAFSCGLAFL